MFKKSLILHLIGMVLVGFITYLLIHYHESGAINLIYTNGNKESGSFRDTYSALVSFYGGNLGFVIASVTIVFGLIDRPTFDKLFRNDTVSQLYILFFFIILTSAINAVIAFIGMLFSTASIKYLTFVVVMLGYWLCSFFYFIATFFTVIKATITDRKNKLKTEANKRIKEMQDEVQDLINADEIT